MLSTVATACLPDGTALSRGEQLGMCAQFVVAGNETTAKAISSAVLVLARRPDLEAELRRDPARIPALVEEVLRAEAPVQGLFREAKVDVEVGGRHVAAGQALFLAYGAANRDPSAWPEPDRIDLDRPAPTVHLAFGQGEHFCLGAALARLEARVALDVLLERLCRLELSERNDLRYEPQLAAPRPRTALAPSAVGAFRRTRRVGGVQAPAVVHVGGRCREQLVAFQVIGACGR